MPCIWVHRVKHSGQMIPGIAEEQMRIMESISVYTTRALQLYGHCFMEAEPYDPEIPLSNPETLAVAIALFHPEGTQGEPIGEAPTLDDFIFRAESDWIAQQAIVNLYAVSYGGHHAPGVEGIPCSSVPEVGRMDLTAAPVTMNLVEDEDEITPLVPVSRAPSMVVSEPDMVGSDAMREDKLPPVPLRSTRSQTPGRGRGRSRGPDS